MCVCVYTARANFSVQYMYLCLFPMHEGLDWNSRNKECKRWGKNRVLRVFIGLRENKGGRSFGWFCCGDDRLYTVSAT